jgi:hypothetical protein
MKEERRSRNLFRVFSGIPGWFWLLMATVIVIGSLMLNYLFDPFQPSGSGSKKPPKNNPRSAESIALTAEMWTIVNGEKRPTYPDKFVNFVVPFKGNLSYWKAKQSLAHLSYDKPDPIINLATPSPHDEPFSYSVFPYSAVLPGNRPLHWIVNKNSRPTMEKSADGKSWEPTQAIDRAAFSVEPCDTEGMLEEGIRQRFYNPVQAFKEMRTRSENSAKSANRSAPLIKRVNYFDEVTHQCLLDVFPICVLEPPGFPPLILRFSFLFETPDSSLGHIQGYFNFQEEKVGSACGSIFVYGKHIREVVNFYRQGIDSFRANVTK